MSSLTSSIHFELIGIAEIPRRYRLAVPLNQREYAWEEEHVQDLFQDINNAIASNKSTYFLGTIVLTAGPKDIPQVTDGQQRLATTTILLAEIRNYFFLKDDKTVSDSIQNDFLYSIDRRTRSQEQKLTLNVDDNEFFRKYILSLPNEEARTIQPKLESHHKLKKAAELAQGHVRNILKGHREQHHSDRLNEWIDYLQNRAKVILLRVPDDLNAFIMFETLNDRGLRPAQSDLVKNYLFDEASTRTKEAQQKWASMKGTLESLGKGDITLTYLRHFLIAYAGHVREREVLDKIKESIKGKDRAIEFLTLLSALANDYVALEVDTHQRWNDYPESIRGLIRALALLGMTPMRPLMLAVIHKFNPTNAAKAFKLFVSSAVRFLIVGGGRSGRIEEALAACAHKVMQGTITNMKQLSLEMESFVPTDKEFETDFSTATVSQHYLGRYYLRAIELKLNKDPEPELVPNEDKVITLEHILPANPEENWPDIKPDVARAFYKRIGNMVLLGASKNVIVGNEPFKKKKKVYRDSLYITTNGVAKYEKWGPEEIEDRQKKLAKHAIDTWPLRG